MAAREVSGQPWTIRIPADLFDELNRHLFQRDGAPHGGALLAGVARNSRGSRLLVRSVIAARDGIDYVPSTSGRGHHRLTADFVRDAAVAAAAEGLAYLPIHVHGGRDYADFSSDDLRSHERGYPALLDLLHGGPVAALVFAEGAVAGDIWLPDGTRAILDGLIVVGPRIEYLRPAPLPAAIRDPDYDRQARLFGDAGQAILRSLKVGVIGAGGMGMLTVEYLARLGVGHLLVIDPDRVETSNLPRIPGARRSDARRLFASERWPDWLRAFGARAAKRKVDLARRLAREASRGIVIEPIFEDVREPAVAARLTDCDYLFLAANSDQARLLFNAICQQYLIPGVQLGAKVRTDPLDGRVTSVHSIARSVVPGRGCLRCNGLISPTRMAQESASPNQRRVQRYVDDANVEAPSVITLNATAAAIAANDFLFSVTGLTDQDAPVDWARVRPTERGIDFHEPSQDPACAECSLTGRLGRGDGGPRLPTFYRS
jgi:molybdopterin/thiamine biosynthesis adenylyltransferase